MTSENNILQNPILDFHTENMRSELAYIAERKSFPQSVLVTGPAGIQKKLWVHRLILGLQCENKKWFEPCGTCPTCTRNLKKEGLDTHWIENEDKPLGVESIRLLHPYLGRGPAQENFRIIVLPKADTLTLQAANAFLKLLEEPPKGWIFVLVAQDLSNLPLTLVSRCTLWKLKPIPVQKVEEVLALEGVPAERILVAQELATGNLDHARWVCSDDGWNTISELVSFVKQPLKMADRILDLISKNPVTLQSSAGFLEWVLKNWLENHLLTKGGTQMRPGTPSPFLMKILVQTPTDGLSQFCQKELDRISFFWENQDIPIARKTLAQDLILPWTLLGSRV